MFEYVDGAFTVERATGIVYLLRYHKDANKIPGDVEWTCAVEVDSNGVYEIKIFCSSDKDKKRLLHGRRQLWAFIKSIGCKAGAWQRYKNDKQPKVKVK